MASASQRPQTQGAWAGGVQGATAPGAAAGRGAGPSVAVAGFAGQAVQPAMAPAVAVQVARPLAQVAAVSLGEFGTAPQEGGGVGKRKAEEEGDAGGSGAAAKKAKDDDFTNTLGTVVDEAAEAKAMGSTKYARSCEHKCTDVPFLQYDKDGPRRTGPLVQHLQNLIARHSGEVQCMENTAIDLLSLACEQVCLSFLHRFCQRASFLAKTYVYRMLRRS